MTETKTDHARDQAKCQLESITAMMKRLDHSRDCEGEAHGCSLTDAEIHDGLGLSHSEGDKATDEERTEYHDQEAAKQRIWEDPLELSIRDDWHAPNEGGEAIDYLILLCTGGPAVRIIGELDKWTEPETARLEYQDWFTPWENYPLDAQEEETLLNYARQFYFGEG